MTITKDEIDAVAPDVPADVRARNTKTTKRSPFISLKDLQSICSSEDLDTCLKDMVVSSLKYYETICRFTIIVRAGSTSKEDDVRGEIEGIRTKTHDATIDSINILSRSLKKAGKDISWISPLIAGGRPAYGLFTIFIATEAVLSK